jgi:hypothetical protein
METVMPNLATVGRIGLVVGLAALVMGGIAAGGAALAAGDWWLARQPWIDIGLTLLVIGLAVTAVFALVLVVVEPLGRLRLLAVPPALIVGAFWAMWLVVGLPTTGPGGPERDVRTILYSVPEALLGMVVATLLIALPRTIARLSRRGMHLDTHAEASIPG